MSQAQTIQPEQQAAPTPGPYMTGAMIGATKIEILGKGGRRAIATVFVKRPPVFGEPGANEPNALIDDPEGQANVRLFLDALKTSAATNLMPCKLAEQRTELLEAIEAALRCTPQVRDGAIVYDCGDPWKILRAARAKIAGGAA